LKGARKVGPVLLSRRKADAQEGHRGRKTERGYRVEHFAEAFRHYLPEVRKHVRPSAGLDALLTLMLFGMPLDVIGIIGCQVRLSCQFGHREPSKGKRLLAAFHDLFSARGSVLASAEVQKLLIADPSNEWIDFRSHRAWIIKPLRTIGAGSQ
jgi:hypothetical protein